MRIWRDVIVWEIAIPMVMTLVLLLSLFGGFLFYHSLAELFSIIVAYLAFVVAAYTYRYSRNDFLMFLGIVFFWTGSLDLVHTLTYKGIGVFPDISANVPTQYWIAARTLAAISFLVSPWFLRHRLPATAIFVFYGLIVVLLAAMISSGIFPHAYIEGQGLTPFKVYSEYVIIAILLVTLMIFVSMRNYIESEVLWPILTAIVLTMLTEVVFTLYVSLEGFTMILGHALKFLAFWMVFQALVRIALMKPFALMSRTSSTYDAIPESTVLLDEHCTVQQANSATYRATGLQMSEVVGQQVHALLHDSEVSEEDCPICHKIKRFESLGRHDVQHRDRWYRISLAPVNVEGAAVGMVHVAYDITERKLANQELRRSEEQFRQLAENINEVFWLTDPQKQKAFYVSPAYERIWGRPLSEVYATPKSFMKGIHPQDVMSVEQALKKQALGEYDEFYRVVRPDGSIRWIRDRAFPVRSDEGEVYRIAGLATDITQQIEAEDAKRSNQAKSEFLSRMSHELRTPLTAVLGFSQLLETEAESLSKEQQDFVAEIHRAGEHLLDLVNDVLDLSRIETGQLQVSLEELYIAEVMEECVEGIHPLAEKNGLLVDCEPALYRDVRVQSDRTRLKQVMLNLLNNAVKYNRPGGKLSCRLEQEEDGLIKVSIRDTGPGMSREEMEQIFEPFFRLRHDSGVDGVGIGLTLTRYLVELMGGRMGVESEPGVGSHFWFTLDPT